MVKPALTHLFAVRGLVSCNSCCFLVGGGVFAIVSDMTQRADRMTDTLIWGGLGNLRFLQIKLDFILPVVLLPRLTLQLTALCKNFANLAFRRL